MLLLCGVVLLCGIELCGVLLCGVVLSCGVELCGVELLLSGVELGLVSLLALW